MMVLIVMLIGINWVVDYVETNMDVAVTTKVVVIMQVISAMTTIKPALAVGTGIVSGGANVTVTAAVEVPESAQLQISFN